jgi:hypothetical protein
MTNDPKPSPPEEAPQPPKTVVPPLPATPPPGGGISQPSVGYTTPPERTVEPDRPKAPPNPPTNVVVVDPEPLDPAAWSSPPEQLQRPRRALEAIVGSGSEPAVEPAPKAPPNAATDLVAQLSMGLHMLRPVVGSSEATALPQATHAGVGPDRFDIADAMPAAISPTHYPDDPSGQIVVENHITINFDSPEFRHFSATMTELLAEVRQSNVIAGEVRDQLIAELKASRTILESPKPSRSLLQLLLVRPLRYIAEKGAGAVIGKLAAAALGALEKFASGLF